MLAGNELIEGGKWQNARSEFRASQRLEVPIPEVAR
jgi:hypothetical protein